MLDSEPIGRLYVARWKDEIRIMDIALLPEYRNGGIGGGLLRDLLEEAAATSRRLTIHVQRYNPALRLYRRLGLSRSAKPAFISCWRWERRPTEKPARSGEYRLVTHRLALWAERHQKNP